MISWIPYTFVRTVSFFAGGIILGIHYPDLLPQRLAFILWLALLLAYLLSFIIYQWRNRSFFHAGLVGLPTVFVSGYVCLLLNIHLRAPDHFITAGKPITYYRAVIASPVEEKENSWKAIASVQHVFTGHWQHKQGRVVLYFSKAAFKTPYQYGDVLLIKGSPLPVSAPSNPGEFDYRRFLSYRGIYHQHYLRSGAVQWLTNDPPCSITHYALKARIWAEATLATFIHGAREQAIASALVLGVTGGLDHELLSAYANTGTLHVLAVSGLHVSILYVLLVWMMKPLVRLRYGPWMLATTALIVLWAYAFITGLSPSVLRAVTMFSFIVAARPAGQSTNIYNTLAASAFCLLLCDPFMIMSVGFQLSYLAVLGIVYLHPPLYRLWEPRGWLWHEAWKITSVSIAAQVATFALGIFYFHQFPGSFLLSNLVAIPASVVALVSGIGLLAFSSIQAVAMVLGWISAVAIKLLNSVMFTLEALPFSVVKDIYISTLQCWLILGGIIVFALLVEYKRFYYVVAALGLAVLFAALQWHHFSANTHLKKITVYNVQGHSAIDLIDRGHACFIADSALLHNRAKVDFHIAPNRLLSGINRVSEGGPAFVKVVNGASVMLWRGALLVQVRQRHATLPEGPGPRWLVVGNDAVADVTRLVDYARHTLVILDSSNSYFYTEKVLAQARRQNVAVYSVRHRGAFTQVLNDIDI